MLVANAVQCSSTIVPPVKIIVLVVCVMPLPIDRALHVLLPTTRQQLVEAKTVPNFLACTSTAPQL